MNKSSSVGTNMLVALNIIIMIALIGYNFHNHNQFSLKQDTLINFGGIIPQKSSYLTILSSMFLHAGIIHIVMNMLTLKIIGNEVEKFLGKSFVPFYLLSGIVSGLGLYVFGSNQSLGVGASGAICGILGAKLVYVFKYNAKKIEKIGISVDITIILAIGLIPGVSGLSHFFGLVFGVISSLIFFSLNSTVIQPLTIVNKKETDKSLIILEEYQGNR